jgi:serine/threonine-protein kinase RsbW
MKSGPDAEFCLMFRCERLSVPVMRRVLGDTLRGLGVDEEAVYDILLAATEACTNVLQHSGREGPGYAVMTSVGPAGCQVEVADAGTAASFPDPARREPPHPPVALAESGRGLAVMRACVDNVILDSSPDRGTVVTLRKRLDWSQDAPLRQGQMAS